MAAPIDIAVYSDALVVLGTAGVVVPLVRRSGLNPVIGFLAAGAILGPLGLGSFVKAAPMLYWLTIADAAHVSGIAELGIVFLLFLIGLELSFQRLMTMRRLVFGLGGLQFLLTTALLAGAFVWLGLEASQGIALAASLSLSSTALVLELLSSQGRLASSAGRSSFAVLLAQDIAVIPVLMFISIAGSGDHGSVFLSVGRALVQAAAAVAVIVLFGRFLMRPLFRQVAATQSKELFIAAVLFVIVGAGVVAHLAGLSMALGAFIAGLLLAETEYDKAIQATVEPFKGLLLGIFFFAVGMSIDFRQLVGEPVRLLACVVALIAIKSAVMMGLGKLFRLSWPTSIEIGLLLGPGGEFAFVGLGMAAAVSLIDRPLASFVLAVVAVTMALTPLLSVLSRRIAARLSDKKAADPVLAVRPAVEGRRAIVVGYGRVGKTVCALMRKSGTPFVAADNDAIAVSRDRRAGHEVYFGDAAELEFLMACGLMDATGVIITINSHRAIDRIVAQVRALRPDILIIARARDAAHATHLYAVGATDAVPETVEASFQLSEAALVGLGVPIGTAIASIHEMRDEVRRDLQKAAQMAGRDSYAAKRPKIR